MNNLRMCISLIFACLISFPAAAVVISGNVDITGNLVTLSTGKHEQTSRGQVFTFLFDDLPQSDGITDGDMFIQARGDYSIGHVANENINVSIDGFNTGQYGATQANSIQNFNFEDNEWSTSSVVPRGLLSVVTSDGEISLVVTLSREVEIGLAAHQATTDYLFDPYVDVTLSYTVVPIPMGIALFATALFSLVTVRRKSLCSSI